MRHGHCAATQRDLVMAWGKQIISSQVPVGAFLNPSDVRMIAQPSQNPTLSAMWVALIPLTQYKQQ